MAVVLPLVPPFLLLRSSHGSHTRPCSVAIKSDDCCRSLLAIVINMTLPRLLRKVSVFAHTIESIHGPWQICGHGAVVGCNSWARPPSFVPSIVTALYVGVLVETTPPFPPVITPNTVPCRQVLSCAIRPRLLQPTRPCHGQQKRPKY